jgi:hypothetical protein
VVEVPQGPSYGGQTVGTQKAWDAGDRLKWWLRRGDRFAVRALINVDWVG